MTLILAGVVVFAAAFAAWWWLLGNRNWLEGALFALVCAGVAVSVLWAARRAADLAERRRPRSPVPSAAPAAPGGGESSGRPGVPSGPAGGAGEPVRAVPGRGAPAA